MKAAIFEDVKKIIYREDYPDPEPGDNDVILKVHYCGICGSDVTNYKIKMYQVPLIMGHEFTGEVVEIGTNIKDIKIGDKACGINVKLDLSEKNLDGMGIFQDGGFAEFVKVPRKYLFHIPNTVSTKEALMIESFANAARGVRLSKIGQNEKVVIIGGGNIGLCFLKYILNEKKPKYLVIVEPHEYLRNMAKKMGASEAFPPNKSKIKKYFKDNGSPTFIFDCAGNEKSILLAIDLVERGGTILLEGVYKGSVSFPMFLINSKEVTITGVLGHDYEDINLALNFFSQKKVDANEHITQIMPLNEIQNAFEKFLEPGERKFVKIGIKI